MKKVLVVAALSSRLLNRPWRIQAGMAGVWLSGVLGVVWPEIFPG